MTPQRSQSRTQAIGLALARWLEERRSRRATGTRPLLLVIAVLLFVGAAAIGFANLPDVPTVRVLPLAAVALLGVPLMVALNALEYRLAARILDYHVPVLDASRFSVLGTAANILPVPGSVLVRLHALHGLGASLRRATLATAIPGIVWIGTTGTLAGAFQLPASRVAAGVLVGLGGVVFLVLGFLLLRTQASAGRSLGLMAQLLSVEAATVLLTAVRLLLVLAGLGFSVSLSQAVALSVAVTAAAAIGIFPGGFGLREVIAGGIAPIVGLSAALGVVATTVDRLIGTLGLALIAAALFVRDRVSADSPREEGGTTSYLTARLSRRPSGAHLERRGGGKA